MQYNITKHNLVMNSVIVLALASPEYYPLLSQGCIPGFDEGGAPSRTQGWMSQEYILLNEPKTYIAGA